MSTNATATSDQGRLRLLLGVLAGVVVLALLWFFVLSPLLAPTDDDLGADAAQPTDSEPVEPIEPDVEADDEDALLALPVETYEIFLARDPFDPVVPEPAVDGGTDGTGTNGDGTDGDGTAGDGNGDGTDDGVQQNAVLIDVFTDDSGTPRALIRVDDLIYTVGEGDAFADGYVVVAIEGTCITLTLDGEAFTLCEGGGGTGDPGNGNGNDDGDGGDAGGSDACTNGDEVVCDGRVVTLVDVFDGDDGEPVAVVQVDTTIYEVRRGDTFAQNFQVVAVDPPCVTLLFGDDAFTLCEGQRTLK
jgi:hypothetical protein